VCVYMRVVCVCVSVCGVYACGVCVCVCVHACGVCVVYMRVVCECTCVWGE
jgi:hypothetical protein